MRAQFTNLVEIRAECEDCGAVWETGNAQGLASQHAMKHGHMVGVTVSRYYLYATAARYAMRPAEAKQAFGATPD